ncbi:hypothetical protein RRG08_063778 [Elysia crispata]|uniref:Uncharacterized protein n=1 Tax=Elysia crispata TaxID=231223 RepID=A0AAE1E024_9GAST|nr:hypothetical protein RRG08_063778 [Elysia crispata]
MHYFPSLLLTKLKTWGYEHVNSISLQSERASDRKGLGSHSVRVSKFGSDRLSFETQRDTASSSGHEEPQIKPPFSSRVTAPCFCQGEQPMRTG